MKTMFRMLAGFGLLALGYYVGREVGKNDHIRRELEEMRNQQDPEEEGMDAPTPKPKRRKPARPKHQEQY